MRALALICAMMLSVCRPQTASGLLGKEDQRIDGNCKYVVANVDTMDGCMCYLLDHANDVEAVSFDRSNAKCIAAPLYGKYTIVHATGWITYTLEHDHEAANSSNYAIITETTNWTVPANVYSVRALCIGGGGGGYDGPYGGSGSGYIDYGNFSTYPGRSHYVYIGAGGVNGRTSGPSGIDYLIVAPGGNNGLTYDGGNGGSGGGAANGWSYTGSKGGIGGNNGEGIKQKGGIGQGPGLWSAAIATIKSVTITYGSAGAAFTPGEEGLLSGGSGAGGIIVNGQYITAGDGAVLNISGHGGVGYGAGGGGSGCTSNDGNHLNGAGANGVCIIEW